MKSLNLIGIPEPADKILTDLVAGIENIKQDFIEGIYLKGSIPLTDFYPNKSDIDFLILCKNLPDKEVIKQLEQLHKKIKKKFKRPKLSGTYITPDCLRTRNQQTLKVFSVFEGKMFNDVTWGTGLTTVTLKELQTTALTIFGKPACILPIEIKDEELNLVLFKNINSYWRKWINRHSSFNHRHLFLIFVPQLIEWVVLGVARQLYTLETGNITSKLKAGYYGLEVLPVTCHNILNEAIEIRKNNQILINPSLKRAHEAIECVNYIIDKFNSIYKNNTNN